MHRRGWGGTDGRREAPPATLARGLKERDESGLPHLVVDGDAVGPADADVDQDGAVGAVQAGALDAGVLAPLGPEQVPEKRPRLAISLRSGGRGRRRLSPSLGMDGYGAGLVQALGDDHVAERAV